LFFIQILCKKSVFGTVFCTFWFKNEKKMKIEKKMKRTKTKTKPTITFNKVKAVTRNDCFLFKFYVKSLYLVPFSVLFGLKMKKR
jgi:hypothetical protein